MTKKVTKFLVVAIASIHLSTSAQEKALAETGVSKILSFYENSIKRLSFTLPKVQDIELACMGEIYLQWFSVYTDTIARTPDLNFSDVGNFRKAEQRAHLIEYDLPTPSTSLCSH